MKILLIMVSIIFFSSCTSSYHYGNLPKDRNYQNCSISTIRIGNISSSQFYKSWERNYFKRALKREIENKSNIKVNNSAYSVSIDIYDNSSNSKEKMGKFLGQKQYRIIQDYDISAWYRIRKRVIIKQGTVHYTPYADVGSGSSFEDAKKRVVKKKLDGIAKLVAREILNYFRR